ncbi:MAG: pyridoxal phosphate-dependent aminotransferase [Actinomycetes bacterium]
MISHFPDAAANLVLDSAIAARQRRGERVLHLGFGESRLPIFDGLRDALVRGASENAYGPIPGRDATRAAVAGYFERRGLDTSPDQIVLAPGSKVLLFATLAALGAPVVLATPSWLTYEAQAAVLGLTVHRLPTPAGAGGGPDPDSFAALMRDAARPRVAMVLTSPDNPTGASLTEAHVEALAATAGTSGAWIISDEIYADVTFGTAPPPTSAARFLPDSTVVVTGLSKSLSLGGWRIGAARFPDTAEGRLLRDRVVSLGSQTWSNLAAPMQSVAEYAFGEPAELVAYRQQCTDLHEAVAREVLHRLELHGAACRPVSGGFYVYPDFEAHRGYLETHGVTGSASFERWSLDHLGVAVMGGHHFGDDPTALRVRIATSMLYGDTREMQQEALDSDRPTEVPHVAQAIGSVEDFARSVAGGARADHSPEAS